MWPCYGVHLHITCGAPCLCTLLASAFIEPLHTSTKFLYRNLFMAIVGASLSKPHTCQTASPTIYRTSFRKCPRVLIHCTASILLSVIQFCKYHHIQIIETISIFYLQWATMSMCTLLIQLGQAKSVNYSYSELSYVSAKLYRSSVG